VVVKIDELLAISARIATAEEEAEAEQGPTLGGRHGG